MENGLGEKRKRRIRRRGGGLSLLSPYSSLPTPTPSRVFPCHFLLRLPTQCEYLAERLLISRPFLSYLKPLFQSEAKCEAIGMKMILACVASVSVKGIFGFGLAKNGTRAKKEGVGGGGGKEG